ncbi:YqzK family protein [Niallia sp. Krafla_26]|uniref:YqzK family protein n=1 Tax=Niallia sp. Krafla_26 TaxID=3064703 RepID=UPI003D184693
MGKWFRMMFHTLKVFILFTGCTILFYYGIMWLNEEYTEYHRYDEPQGSAIKVTASGHDENSNWFDRLLLFYLNGE